MASKGQDVDYNSEELLNRAQKCKREELDKVLKEIEVAIKKTKENDENLLRAKKAATSRMASRGK